MHLISSKVRWLLKCLITHLIPVPSFYQICDAVAVAKILNATLVVPHFEVNSVWQDSRYIKSRLFLKPFCL